MDDRIRRALSRGHLIDLTTTGRQTGQARRIELVFHAIDGPRATSAACPDSPQLAGQCEGQPGRDLPPEGADSGRPAGHRPRITEPAERRRIMERVAANWGRNDVDVMMTSSPLIEVEIPGLN
jgi:hypothetical protein